LFDIEMEIEPGDGAEFGLRLHETGITWASGKVSALGCTAEAPAIDGVVHLRILVDRTSIETFANHGALSMTSCFLPKEQRTGIELYAKDGDVNIRSLRVTKLKSCWTESTMATDTVDTPPETGTGD
jgi:sucrose-6-phosphate hydrolase SacC (GH32 family)